MKREPKQRRCLRQVLAAILLCGAAWSASAQEQPAKEEYRVYEAVLGQLNSIPKADPHVEIYDRTLNSKCDGQADNPVLANGCTFFWVSPDTSQDVEQRLRKRWRGLERSTWKSFKTSNTGSVILHDPISTPWKHRFRGTNSPGDKDWESPDMTIFLSRVGFNSRKTEAVVYVLVFSYEGRVATTGDYLLFRAGPDKAWTLTGRVSYLTQDENSFASLEPGEQRERVVSQLRSIMELK
jgi:hypothetical protein